MLQTVNANTGRMSWRMKLVLLLGGLAVLALPAVYLSRATIAQAEDPPQTAPAADPFAEKAEVPPAEEPDNPVGSLTDEAPAADESPLEAPQARVLAPDEQPIEAPRAARATATFEPVSEPSVEFLPEPSQSEKLILAALDRKVTLDFTETPLIDVVSFLEEAVEHQVQMQLDNRALEDAGIGADTPVTRHVKDVKLRTALKLLLGEYDLTYLASDDVMLITTVDKAETELITRTYPVGDLLAKTPAASGSPAATKPRGGGLFQVADKPAAETPQAAKPGTPAPKPAPAPEPVAAAENAPKGGGGVVGAAKTGTQRAMESRQHNQDPYDVLIEVITSTVKPQTWDEVGGPGSISAVPVARSLVISQTREVHDEVLDLIRSLRAAKRASGAKSSAD